MTEAFYTGTKRPLLNLTIGQLLEKTVAENADRDAVVFVHQGVRWSYREFNEQVNRLALGLMEIGVQKGDRVGIWSPNRVEWLLTQFATAKIGAILVCVNPAYRRRELEYVLRKSGCSVLVTAAHFKTTDYLEILSSVVPELADCAPGALKAAALPELRYVVRMGEEKTPGAMNFGDLMELGGTGDQTKLVEVAKTLNYDDPINIQFTSGTTGSPKGATLSHQNIANNAFFCATSMRLVAGDRLCIPVPFYHCFGMVLGTLLSVSVGATMVIPSEGFEPEATLQAVSDERCTALHGVPTMFTAELDLPDLTIFDLSAVRTGIIAGSLCSEDLMNRLIAEMDLREIVIAYGQTECSPVNAMTEIDDTFVQRTATVGRAHYNWEQKIVREDGSIANYGEQGEICSRGYGVMAGYWDEPERTAETIDAEGFLHSGDLGEMDADGYVKVTGRIKDMIIRGGENIYPKEVEELLILHPEILEAQVFGIPDDRYGEQVVAWVRKVEGSALGESDVRGFCAEQITHFKVPKHVRFVDEFPMTVTGKYQKFAMRDAMAKELAPTA